MNADEPFLGEEGDRVCFIVHGFSVNFVNIINLNIIMKLIQFSLDFPKLYPCQNNLI